MKPSIKIDFLGIGPPKAGTTWLGHMLERHPEICMSEPKEVNYFNESLSFNKSQASTNYHRGEHWYANHFKHCQKNKLKGEITPRYILDPVVPQRIKDHNPDIKLIVCLRTPNKRIISHYHSAKDFHKSEKRPISVAIREEPEYIGACLYYKNLAPFFSTFDLKQFYFMDLDEAKSNPAAEVKRLYTFLRVDPSFLPDNIMDKSNPARATKSVRLRKAISKIHGGLISSGLSPFIIFLKKLGLGRIINSLNSAPIKITELSPEDKLFIKNAIEEDVQKLSLLLGKDFSHWLIE